MDIISENEFKKLLLDKLNSINGGWIDGDQENTPGSKADIINNSLKIAIEIKDDSKYEIKIPTPGVIVSGYYDLKKMNERFNDDIKSANKKFSFYPCYKTTLLIRTNFSVVDIIRYSIEGPKVLHINLSTNKVTGVSRLKKYSDFVFKNIGQYLIFTRKAYYFPNKLAEQSRVLEKAKIEKMSGLKFEDVPSI